MEVNYSQSHLLDNAINLRKRYKLVDNLSARPFNIFSILRIERNEKFTHSAFIAEMLNPKGTHCQGDTFLRLFLNEIHWPEFSSNDIAKANVIVEHYTGDGFIDIWINLGNAYLLIENKIDATDQIDQLTRYNDYCVKHKKPYKIIYLTLDGHESKDAKEAKLEYLAWSYNDKIFGWLDKCMKECARVPVLRETIYQYQQLIKKLSNKLQNENEAMELNDLIKSSKEQFEAANNIHEQFKTAKYDIKYNFWKGVETYFIEKYGDNFDIEFSFDDENNKYSHIIIGHKNCLDWYVCFCIENFMGRTYYGMYSYLYDDRSVKEKEMIESYKELYSKEKEGFKRDYKYWLAWRYYNIDFSNIQTLLKTFSIEERKILMNQIIEPMEELIEKHEKRVLEINNEIRKRMSKLAK